MATLAAYQNGNFTGSTTFKTVDTTSYLMSAAGSTATTTSYVASASFSPGAITVEGIGLFIANRASSPSGTLDVQLWNATTSSQAAICTVNVADIPAPATSTTLINHVFFSFTPVLLVAGNNYQVRVKSSVASTITLYRNATAGNWSRWLRTSTTATRAIGDNFIICGELTGAGTNNPITVTMDNNTTDQYGTCIVGWLGTLDWSTTSTTELRLGGDLFAGTTGASLYISSGTVNIGTSSSRVGSSYTATLRFNSTGTTTATMNGIYLYNLGTLRAYGQQRTTNWNFLASDAAVSDTILTLDNTHGWAIGDDIAIAPTARTIAQYERKTLTGVTSNTVSFSGGLTYAHSGTSPTQGEVINLTRNVSIRGNSSTQTTFISCSGFGTTIDFDSMMIESAGGGRASVICNTSSQTTSGSTSITNCAFKDCGAAGAYISCTLANPKNIVADNNVFYAAPAHSIVFSSTAPTASSGCSVDGNIVIGSTTTGIGIAVNNNDIPVTNNRASGCISYGITYGLPSYQLLNQNLFTDNVSHTNGQGFLISLMNTVDNGNHADSNSAWRNTNYGFVLYGCVNSKLENCVSFGNTVSNILFSNSAAMYPTCDFVINNFTGNGEASFSTQYGLTLTAATSYDVGKSVTFNNCSFGATTAHTVGDIRTSFTAGLSTFANISMNDCTLASTTPVLSATDLYSGGYISMQKFNGSSSDHRKYMRNGVLQTDSTIKRSSPLSARLTPSSASLKQEFARKYVAVASGATTTIGVYVRCSVVGDGTAYNGNRPRLILLANPSLGVDTDQVLATATSSANGAWELISGTTPTAAGNGVWEVYVDCDGTTGWVNADDWSVS